MPMKLQKTAIHEQTTTQIAASFNSPKVRLEENDYTIMTSICIHGIQESTNKLLNAAETTYNAVGAPSPSRH